MSSRNSLRFTSFFATALLGLWLGHFQHVTATTLPQSHINPNPTISLGYGSFQGAITGETVQFLGMPFAAPPVRDLRFAPPQPPVPFKGVRNATSYGNACFQQDLQVFKFFGDLLPAVATAFNVGGAAVPTGISEDCLFINVIRPSNVPAGKKLPVVFWIYAGGFSVGDTSFYPGEKVVERSIALGEPIVYVSANYRVSGFGFLGGKEIKSAGLGNNGLRDQRLALQWVQDHISAFGGDPRRVTLWGQSAGAISTGTHLVINEGNPAGLFHGAFMESGFPMSLPNITSKQTHFDQLVADTNCSGSADKIACLRDVPFDKLGDAMNLSPSVFSYTAFNFPWIPTVDGEFIVRSPQQSIRRGLFAKVPIVAGDCDDEGTLFSLGNTNITTDAEFLDYMKTNYFQSRISDKQLAALGAAYPSDPAQGSPFDTGSSNARTPQYKRLAAIQGDFAFHGPRRFLLQAASKTQPAFSFLWKRNKSTPDLGAFHASDVREFFGTADAPDFVGTDAVVNFVNTGSPVLPHNPQSAVSDIGWKPWDSSTANPPLLTFLDPAPAISITSDNFRQEEITILTDASLVVYS